MIFFLYKELSAVKLMAMLQICTHRYKSLVTPVDYLKVLRKEKKNEEITWVINVHKKCEPNPNDIRL